MKLTATIIPHTCDNPNHPEGCAHGFRLIECPEDCAHTWLATVSLGGVCLWTSGDDESRSRVLAKEALLRRLAEGVEVSRGLL